MAAFQLHVEDSPLARLTELDEKYLAALGKAIQAATQGNLGKVLVLRAEMERVQAKGALPDTDEGDDPALANLRRVYREQLGKQMVELRWPPATSNAA